MKGFMGLANDGGCGNDTGPQNETPFPLPRFDIVEGQVVFKSDGMCVHSALVDEVEEKLTNALRLLAVWHEAFGAECYNDALIAHDAETERLLKDRKELENS